MDASRPSLLLFAPPYRILRPVETHADLPRRVRERRGAALVWPLSGTPTPEEFEMTRGRTPGVALIVILPPADALGRPEEVLRIVELCRPHSILPHHRRPNVMDLRHILSRPPEDLPSEVSDYLTWRGLVLDMETRRLIRKTMELSAELTSVNGLARALYLSRRALGRRFTTRGLPVPSHWLHLGRILRSAMHLQDTGVTLLEAASSMGYPDGFALSNQMLRLIGIRPTVARRSLGWEWILEEWLLREARKGGLAEENVRTLGMPGPGAVEGNRRSTPSSTGSRPRKAAPESERVVR